MPYALPALAFALFLVTGVIAKADGRYALLIGNSEYNQQSFSLVNPVNDIIALGEALGRLGFDVTTLPNAGRDQMTAALDSFSTEAKGAEIALVFYAGHGIQVDGDNYMIGVDFEAFTPDGVQNSSLRMSEAVSAISSLNASLGMVFLDACRNNPISGQTWTKSGLAQATGNAGLLIAYATDPENVAYDGAGKNSIFTQALLDNIETDALDVRLMLGRVRQQVILNTDGDQIPWVSESVLGEHYLGQSTPNQLLEEQLRDELADWTLAQRSDDPLAISGFLDTYPDGVFSDAARNILKRLSDLDTPRTNWDTNAGELLVAADLGKVDTALDTLGFLSSRRSVAPIANDELEERLEAYKNSLPDAQNLSLDRLYQDAGRTIVYRAASAASRIRDSLKDLKVQTRILKFAEDSVAQLEALLNGDTQDPALVEVRGALSEIQENRAKTLASLDTHRAYYAELLSTSKTHFHETIRPDLVGEQLNRDISQIEQTILRDAIVFANQVTESRNLPDGSMAWLKQFLPETE